MALSSLRANGSRECAPDDRLREAIHSHRNGDNGLLRRFRLPPSLSGRSLSYGGQVAPRNDVKSKYDSAISRRDGPEFCKNCFASPWNRGRGECRVPNAPAASRAKWIKHTSVVTTGPPEQPAFPHAMVYGLLRALPGDQALLSPSPALLLADLTPASGRQNHTTSPYASASFVRLAIRAPDAAASTASPAQRP